ncbi:branched-chain amino acid transport system substrate-binding protein [Micromonospora viridifaciens]|uniref:Branched-chain amino acid transport system substrate-binding protein n=1 Tax=Micromonospora viridifaciens TaxID=1881 RepID=A0A1C4W5U2_MICVI|nr:branched-chain amino acid ABC transporter substrate-binding protein [Micromonospora viridifaciens]SCE91554.1 branched-chain amino acid transport system substrate-binding protein [Micromonospora viridifaciens]
MRQKLARVLGGVAAMALAVGGAAACKSDSGSEASGGACGYKIVFFGALTGPDAGLGINENNGVKLAVDQYNKANKDCTVELLQLDSQGSPDQAPQLANQAIDDEKVLGVVGPAFSGESEAANPLFNEAGLVHITASATRPSLSQQGWKTFFRSVGNDNAQGPAAAKYIKEELKAEKVFVIDDQSAYGAGLADEVKKALGAAVVDTDKVQGGGKQTEFSGTVTKVKASGATAVFFGGYYAEGGLIRKALTNAGVKATMVGADGMKDPAFIDGASKTAAEGTIFTCPCLPASEVKGTFPADYKAMHGTDPGTYSDNAFDAANILLSGIKAGKNTRADLLAYVKGYTGEGVVGSYKFTDTGELDPSAVQIWAYKVENGAIVPVKRVPLT